MLAHGPFRPVEEKRARRIAELLAVVWLLSLTDLLFTLWAHLFTPFYELNPLARAMLENGMIPQLVAFKIVLTAVATVIFWRLRYHSQAEAAMWAMAGIYVMLTIRWSNYTIAVAAAAPLVQ